MRVSKPKLAYEEFCYMRRDRTSRPTLRGYNIQKEKYRHVWTLVLHILRAFIGGLGAEYLCLMNKKSERFIQQILKVQLF